MSAPATIDLLTIAEKGRYQITACLGLNQVITYTDDFELAKVTFEQSFAIPFADNRDAHGGIYDCFAFRTVHSWRGGPAPRDHEAEFVRWLDSIVASRLGLTLITETAVAQLGGEGA